MKVRLKYAYAKFHLPDWGVLTRPEVEVGMAHMPWLDFEEHINLYRMQDTMFMERNGLFNSADLGVTFLALLGGTLPDEYQKKVSKHYPGRWGSVSFGVYNGGGYHAAASVLHRGGEIVGFFPFQRRGGSIQPLGAPMNDYHGIIARPGEAPELHELARLLNGAVTGCREGVALSGDRHLVKRVRSLFNVRGFRAPDGLTRSRLQDSSAEFNAAGGILVRGDRNVVITGRVGGNVTIS